MDQTPEALEAASREAIDFAQLAPSVRDTRPWTWEVRGPRLDLYADRSRLPAGSDPTGRYVTISCGAALHYAAAGATAAGWQPTVEVLPEGPGDPVAAIELQPGRATERARRERDLLLARASDRRRFVDWPVPPQVLTELAAAQGPAEAVPVTSMVERLRIELLASRAASIAAEARRLRHDPSHPLRPTPFDLPEDAEAVEQAQPAGPLSGGVLILATHDDTPASWVEAGRLLCREWTAAIARGLSLLPDSQVAEIEETREVLRDRLLGGERHPHFLLRLGWPELSHHSLPVAGEAIKAIPADPEGPSPSRSP